MTKRYLIIFPIVFLIGITISSNAYTSDFKTVQSVSEKPTANIKGKPVYKPNTLKNSYSIQVGAFLQRENADRIILDLRTKGYEPYIFKTFTSKKQPLYVLRLGDYSSLRQASFAATQFKKLEKMSAVITKYDSTTSIPYKTLALNEGEVASNIISVDELGRIDGRAGTLIDSDELAKIDGQAGTIMPEDEMAKIDAQTGTIIAADELAKIDAQTGTVMPTNELATIDGQTGTLMSKDDLAKVDGQTATPMSQSDLARTDGQTATVMSQSNLSGVSGQAATVMPRKDLSDVDAQAATVMPRKDLSDVDAQAATVMPRKDLSNVDAQAATVMPRKSLSNVDAQAATVMPGKNLSNVDAQAAGAALPADESEPFFLAAQEPGDDGAPPVNQKNKPVGTVDSAMAVQLREQIELLEERVNELREEADVRKILEITEEEKQQEEEEILSATGREYTMAPKGSTYADYGFGYTYNSFDAINNAYEVEHRASHNLTNSISISRALKDNISVGVDIPFIFAYDNMGTEAPKETTDLGDVSFNMQWQPLKAGGKYPAPILNFGYSYPTGRSPYDINPDHDLSTGSGTQSIDVGLSLSQSLDPVMVFGGISYAKAFEIKNLDQNRTGATLMKVDPGQSIGARMGLGYAISYKLNINMSLSYTYAYGNEYIYLSGTSKNMDSASASFNLGTGWRISPKRSFSVSLSKGLSNSSSDFSIAFRIPFNF